MPRCGFHSFVFMQVLFSWISFSQMLNQISSPFYITVKPNYWIEWKCFALKYWPQGILILELTVDCNNGTIHLLLTAAPQWLLSRSKMWLLFWEISWSIKNYNNNIHIIKAVRFNGRNQAKYYYRLLDRLRAFVSFKQEGVVEFYVGLILCFRWKVSVCRCYKLEHTYCHCWVKTLFVQNYFWNKLGK